MPNIVPPPLPTRSQMLDNLGLVSRAWLAWFTTLGQQFGFFQTVQSKGVALPQEVAVNFLAPFIVTDNPAKGSTDVSLPAPPYTLQSGTVQANVTGGDYSAVDVAFSPAFGGVPRVFVSATNYPRGGNEPLICYPTNITAAGFTANLSCAVPTGGGGATIDNQIGVDWMAIG